MERESFGLKSYCVKVLSSQPVLDFFSPTEMLGVKEKCTLHTSPSPLLRGWRLTERALSETTSFISQTSTADWRRRRTFDKDEVQVKKFSLSPLPPLTKVGRHIESHHDKLDPQAQASPGWGISFPTVVPEAHATSLGDSTKTWQMKFSRESHLQWPSRWMQSRYVQASFANSLQWLFPSSNASRILPAFLFCFYKTSSTLVPQTQSQLQSRWHIHQHSDPWKLLNAAFSWCQPANEPGGNIGQRWKAETADRNLQIS